MFVEPLYNPIGKRKLSYWLIRFESGPSTKDAVLPPAGITQFIAELVIVSTLPGPVLINPLVSRRFPATSIAPVSFIRNPELLFISRLLNALVPVKSPIAAPPTV